MSKRNLCKLLALAFIFSVGMSPSFAHAPDEVLIDVTEEASDSEDLNYSCGPSCGQAKCDKKENCDKDPKCHWNSRRKFCYH